MIGLAIRRPLKYSGSVPVGIPPSGSVGDNGALTLGTALQTTYSNGIYLYFGSGKLFAGSAANLYWVVMSSPTVGTVYNNTYSGGQPLPPASATPIVATGPGAYTQVTATDIQLVVETIPGGTLGPNDGLISYPLWTVPNNANSKRTYTWLNSSVVSGFSETTVLVSSKPVRIQNRNNVAAQITSDVSGMVSTGSSGAKFINQDTSVNFTIKYTGYLTNAADYVILEAYRIELF